VIDPGANQARPNHHIHHQVEAARCQ
jgi:hypothetical protein